MRRNLISIVFFEFPFTLKMQLSSGIHDVQKHFALHPYIKLSFNKHTNNKITVATKVICLLRKLWPILPQASLLIIYKYFIKYYLDDESAI